MTPTNVKPWYQSQTIICIIAALVVQLARRAGIDVLPADATEIAVLLADLLSLALTGLAVHGRVVAATPIGRDPRKPRPPGPVMRPLTAFLAPVLLVGALAACASVEARSPAQQVYAIESDLLVPLSAAKAYVERADAEPEAKATIKRLVAGIDRTVMAAQAAVRSGDDPTIPAAIAAASAAGAELFAFLKHKGIL